MTKTPPLPSDLPRDPVASSNEKLQLQSDLVRLLAHDLRGPITVLQSAFSLFPRLLKNNNNEDALELIQSGRDAVVRLASMVDSIIVGMDPHQLQALPMTEDVSLQGEVQQALGELAVIFEARELAVATQLGERARPLVGRTDVLRRAIDNVLINAVEHSPLGGEISVILGEGSGGCQELRVSDQGPGIPNEVREALFAPQSFPDLKAMGTRLGRGLGLAVARLAAERHGGTLRCGTPHHRRFNATFILSIPAAVKG